MWEDFFSPWFCVFHKDLSPGFASQVQVSPSSSVQVQSLLRAAVSQVQVDECGRSDCAASGGCSTQLSVTDSPTLIDSGALSLVSVKVTTSAVCGCAAREMTHRACASYPTNPCLNGGTCIDTQNGYR